MKRLAKTTIICALALIFMLAFALAACSNSGEKLKSAEDIYKHALTLSTFPELVRLDEAELGELGIEAQKLSGYEMHVSKDNPLADEIAVFELSDESYKPVLIRLLNSRLRSAAAAARDYSPEQYDIIQRSAVEEKDGFIFYVVNANSARVVSELKKLIDD
ncbi:MAG: DUF4358 domain-containing protein [Clostridia bacterium]|nr:DUF4358 domain-containing protein [Clostridia bacterium]